MPESLHGSDISFQFESPMRDAAERVKGQQFAETRDLLQAAMELDPSAAYVINPVIALREALEGIGSPANWRRSDQEVQTMQARDAQAAQAQQMLDMAQQGADVAKTAVDAGIEEII